MKLVFYSVILNHHQACLADEFYKILGDEYAFVETAECHDKKGALEDYSKRPYLVKAWESSEVWKIAMQLAETADVCVFGGHDALPFEKARMKNASLSFDMGERMLKRGWLNLFSPRIFKMVLAYHLGRWWKKPIYKLCMSTFAAQDQYKLHSYQKKCYKWGYFTTVDEKFDVEGSLDVSTSEITPLMWCSRFLMWKHPELPIFMAKKLKDKGYRFILNMFGSGEKLEVSKKLVNDLSLNDVVSFKGNMPNAEILQEMRKHEIFLFTSDRNEGWGAVSNESMANGCVLVGSNAIGSVPFLVEDRVSGVVFQSATTDSGFSRGALKVDDNALRSLTEQVEWLLQNPVERKRIAIIGYRRMCQIWSPKVAAKNLLSLIDDLQNGHDTSITEGPCSRAF